MALIAAFVFSAWLLGLIVSDRWWWSQWPAWIPSIVAFAAAAFGLIAAWRPARKRSRRRRRIFVWCALLLLTGSHVAFMENRVFRRAPTLPVDALQVIHWNASPAQPGDRRIAIDRVLDLDAHIVVITDAHAIRWRARARERLGDSGDGHLASSFPFAFISRLPILEVRPLVAIDEIYAAIVRIDARETRLGRELTMLAIDLPSDLSLSRMELTRRLSGLLNEAGVALDEVDIALGDFNITRGSASLFAIVPGMVHAWNEAGRGWSATYPRDWPLAHIDHIFLNTHRIRALDYEVIDLGAARHRAQRAVLENR